MFLKRPADPSQPTRPSDQPRVAVPFPESSKGATSDSVAPSDTPLAGRGSPPADTLIHPLRPRRSAVVFTLVVIAVMVSLGLFIIERYRALQLHSYGELGGLYIDQFLAPYALAHHAVRDSPNRAPGHLRVPLEGLPADGQSIALRVWLDDGSLLYGSAEGDSVDDHDPTELHQALAGSTVSSLSTSGADGHVGKPIPYPYFELYVPIHNPVTGQIIAVGEVYQDATEILKDRAFVERTVWTAIGFATLGVLTMLSITARQSAELKTLLDAEQKMAAQNDRLRLEAEQARRSATQANEEVLNLVGAELHDGPVQLLGLVSLMGSDGNAAALPDGTSMRDLASTALGQLRTISAGLILPEIEELDAGAVLELAVARHRALTGMPVDVTDGLPDVDLDAPRKVCLYRVVQEGLTNATRHGGGTVPSVSVSRSGTALHIFIRSSRGPRDDSSAAPPSHGLGLQGMRRRLEAFGGYLNLVDNNAEVTLHVTLPLPAQETPPARGGLS